jgi:hypothetical protein
MNPTRALIPLFLLALAACGPSKRAPHTTPSSSRTEISAEQIAAAQAVTAYDAVEKLRPNWLRRRGEQSITSPGGGVMVYVNDTRYGDITTLRSIQANMASLIRYYDAASAQYRFGTGNTYGVIQVVTTGAR